MAVPSSATANCTSIPNVDIGHSPLGRKQACGRSEQSPAEAHNPRRVHRNNNAPPVATKVRKRINRNSRRVPCIACRRCCRCAQRHKCVPVLTLVGRILKVHRVQRLCVPRTTPKIQVKLHKAVGSNIQVLRRQYLVPCVSSKVHRIAACTLAVDNSIWREHKQRRVVCVVRKRCIQHGRWHIR